MLAALILILGLALPYIASTRIVRDRIAQEISAWSGYTVRIEGSPRIDVWPRLRAVLRDVSFSDAGTGGERRIGTVERLDVELSALAAMHGEAVFTSARLLKPVLRIGANTETGVWATLAGKGRIRSAIDNARAAAPGSPLPAAPFGSIRIEEGAILLDDGSEQGTPLVTAIAGRIDWPSLDGAGSIAAQGVWRGETIKLKADSASPMLLFAGAAGPLNISLDSALGKTSFSGTANLSAAPHVDGNVVADTASLDNLARWASAGTVAWEGLQAVSISSSIAGDGRGLKLDGLALRLNDSTADGALELAAAPDKISASGSLAFDILPLDGLFEAIPQIASLTGNESTNSFNDLYAPLALDLRLSAGHASAGGLEMADLAATLEARSRFASFEMLDGTALGGALQGGIRVDREAEQFLTTIRLSASGIDGAAFGTAAGMNRLAPTGKASFKLDLKGTGTDLRSVMENGKGRFSARLGAGTLSGLDLAAFLQRSKQAGFFALDETAGGNLAVDGVDIEGAVSDGVATLDKAEARFGERRIWLSGLASYADRSLALSGGVGPLPAQAGQQPDEANFFVGGSWSAPFISPLGAGESRN